MTDISLTAPCWPSESSSPPRVSPHPSYRAPLASPSLRSPSAAASGSSPPSPSPISPPAHPTNASAKPWVPPKSAAKSATPAAPCSSVPSPPPSPCHPPYSYWPPCLPSLRSSPPTRHEATNKRALEGVGQAQPYDRATGTATGRVLKSEAPGPLPY